MNKNVHLMAAKEHLKITEETDKKMVASQGDEKEAFRTVAAQNYFYATTNFIESKLAEKDSHSFDHGNRMRNMMASQGLFSPELIKGYDDVSNVRGKVAYRAKNGKDYTLLKTTALLAEKEVCV